MSRVARPSLAAGRFPGVVVVLLIFLGTFSPFAHAQLLAEASADDAKKARKVAPEEALRFAVRGGDLMISTNLKIAADQRVDLKLNGLPGDAQIERGRRFQFTYTEIQEDDERLEQVNLLADDSGMQLIHTTRVNGVTSTTTLTQDTSGVRRRGRSLEQRTEPVSLRVRSRPRFGGPPVFYQGDLRAGSFDELLRKYPGACAAALVPMLRKLNQDLAVFRVDAHLAWQLFPETFTADAATTSKVSALVERLDARDFRERELATAELDTIGGAAVIVLNDVDRGPLSAEQRTRIDAILARFNRLEPEEVARLLDDAEFLFRCFVYGETDTIRAAAVHVMSQKFGEEKVKPLKPALKLAERLAAADDVRRHIPLQPSPQE